MFANQVACLHVGGLTHAWLLSFPTVTGGVVLVSAAVSQSSWNLVRTIILSYLFTCLLTYFRELARTTYQRDYVTLH